jgi:hypothetical protein
MLYRKLMVSLSQTFRGQQGKPKHSHEVPMVGHVSKLYRANLIN